MSGTWVTRLLAAAEARSALDASRIGVIEPTADEPEAERVLERIRRTDSRPARWLVFGWIGTHPDARSPVLRRSWRIEEACRASGFPTLVLRSAPLVGGSSPLWLRLAREGPGRLGSRPLQPVLERDFVTLVRRVAAGAGPDSGWYEIAGPEILTLGELADLARSNVPAGSDPGHWEPEPAVLREQPLVEPEIWMRAFDVVASRVAHAVESAA